MNKSRIVAAASVVLILAFASLFAGQPYERAKEKKSTLQKKYVNDVFTAMTINNIFSYYSNNGDGSLNPYTSDGGFELQSANGGITIFEEGFVWGGKHRKNDTVKVGGSTYYHGLQAGPILTAGTTTSEPVAASSSDPKYRIYRVRADIGPSKTFDSLKEMITAQELAVLSKYETTTAKDIFDQYVKDWNEWPASDGAPYTDVDGNKVYNPAKDIPGVPGADQTIWYVANDLDVDRAYDMSGSKPIGIEFQRTIWAYRRTGALGSTVFQRNKLINKSGYAVDSMFVAQWADPDMGGGLGYTDDVTGCDTLLGLGFVYNGDNLDGFFGNRPAATGFDFFQGPRVPDSLLPSDASKYFKKNGKNYLLMTTFNFFINSNSTYTDPRHADPLGTTDWYNLLNGLVGRTGAQYINPKTGKPTKYVLSGDPIGGTGWIEDGTIAPPGDRRMALCSGPFTMAAGDTQEIVVAAMSAHNTDPSKNPRVSSVALLKYYDQIAQYTFDIDFNVPAPPPAPEVKIGELDKQIVLEWGGETKSKATENYSSQGYSFQGYNVYQLPGPGFQNANLLATYDKKDGIGFINDVVFDPTIGVTVVKPVQFGADNGVQRYIVINEDAIGGKPLVNGQPYYFAVTAYGYNPTPGAVPAQLESAPTVFEIIPQAAKVGVTYQYGSGDTIKAAHTGPSDGLVNVFVVDPSKLNGHNYSVTFDTTGGSMKWNLRDVTANSNVLTGQTDQTGARSYSISGLQIGVVGAPNDAKNFLHVAGPSGAITPPSYGAFAFNSNGFPTLDGGEAGTGTPINDRPSNDWGGGAWGFNQGGGANATYATFVSRVFRNDNFDRFVPYDFEIRFTAAGGKGFMAFSTGTVVDVPFELWNIGINTPNDASDDFRMIPWIFDEDGNDRFNLMAIDHSVSGGDNDPYTDWIYWYDPSPKTPGSAGYNAFVAAGAAYDGSQGTGDEVMARTVLVNFNSGSVASPTFPAGLDSVPKVGNVIRILATKPNQLSDVFTFTAKAPAYSATLAKADVGKVNVFPNPYFGFSLKETNKYTKFVTFTHLPAKATLNILNLAGVRVRQLVKTDASQFITWDLKNESGLPVASGMYVVQVDMGSLGTKILKLAIIQEVQQLDKY